MRLICVRTALATSPEPEDYPVIDQPNHPDRLLASATHVASIFFPFVGPAVAWVAFRNRGYVVAHARAAIMEALLWKVGLVVAGTISLIHSATNLWHHYQTDWQDFSIWPILGKMLIVYLAFLLLQGLNTLLGIRQALRAYNGTWPGRSR